MSVFLTHTPDGPEDLDEWMAHWGVGDPALHPGGVTEKKPRTPAREVWLLQRKTTPIGKGLAKTSGWAHRAVLKDSGVHLVPGVTYDRVDDDGLHVTVGEEARVLDVDTVVVCAGQESERVALRRAGRGRRHRAPHRRRGRGRRARREAGDQAGHGAGRGPLTRHCLCDTPLTLPSR